MQVTGVSSSNGDASIEAKAAKAGAQFEGILLNTVFSDLQRTFSQLPGAKEDSMAKSYEGFGLEALTSGLARSGGIGLGGVISRALVEHEQRSKSGV